MQEYELKIISERMPSAIIQNIIPAIEVCINTFPYVEHVFTQIDQKNHIITTRYRITHGELSLRKAPEFGITEYMPMSILIYLAIIAVIVALVGVVVWELRDMGFTGKPFVYSVLGIGGIVAITGLICAVRGRNE